MITRTVCPVDFKVRKWLMADFLRWAPEIMVRKKSLLEDYVCSIQKRAWSFLDNSIFRHALFLQSGSRTGSKISRHDLSGGPNHATRAESSYISIFCLAIPSNCSGGVPNFTSNLSGFQRNHNNHHRQKRGFPPSCTPTSAWLLSRRRSRTESFQQISVHTCCCRK